MSMRVVCAVGSTNFDDANDACGNFGHAHAAWVTGGEEDLEGFGAWHHADRLRILTSTECSSNSNSAGRLLLLAECVF